MIFLSVCVCDVYVCFSFVFCVPLPADGSNYFKKIVEPKEKVAITETKQKKRRLLPLYNRFESFEEEEKKTTFNQVLQYIKKITNAFYITLHHLQRNLVKRKTFIRKKKFRALSLTLGVYTKCHQPSNRFLSIQHFSSFLGFPCVYTTHA